MDQEATGIKKGPAIFPKENRRAKGQGARGKKRQRPKDLRD